VSAGGRSEADQRSAHEEWADRLPTTMRCAVPGCEWTVTLPLDEGRLAAQAHRKAEHPQIAAGKARALPPRKPPAAAPRPAVGRLPMAGAPAHRPNGWTRVRILDVLAGWVIERRKMITAVELQAPAATRGALPSYGDCRKVFTSFRELNVELLAVLEQRNPDLHAELVVTRGRRWDRDKVIAGLQELAERLGRQPTSIDDHGLTKAAKQLFDGGWKEALTVAGFTPTKGGRRPGSGSTGPAVPPRDSEATGREERPPDSPQEGDIVDDAAEGPDGISQTPRDDDASPAADGDLQALSRPGADPERVATGGAGSTPLGPRADELRRRYLEKARQADDALTEWIAAEIAEGGRRLALPFEDAA